MITSETKKQLLTIQTVFKNNNINVSFKGVQNTPFIKKIEIMMNMSDFKSINKINLIIKTLETLLNSPVLYYFDNNNIIIQLKQKNNKIYHFENYFNNTETNKNKNYIFLGVDENEKPVYKKLNDLKSVLIAGTSGSGKSNLLHNIILSYLLLNEKNYILLIDPKYTELTFYNKEVLKNRLLYPVAYNYNDILKVLNIFYNLIQARFKSMQKLKQQTSTEPPVLLVIDEYGALFNNNKEKNKVNNLICKIASIGRASNCFLLLSTQYPTNQNINNSIRVNLQTKIALHCESNNQSYNIIGSNEAIKLKPPGEFIIKPDGENMQKLKACYISNELLIKTLKN